MDELLWPRVLAAFGVDANLAAICGLLLGQRWLGKQEPSVVRPVWLRTFTVSLFAALCMQFVLLASNFSGQTSPQAVLAAMPDVGTTHAGCLLLAQTAVALLLCLVACIPASRSHTIVCPALATLALALHATAGHAAVNGPLSLAELLQTIHLFGMAIWAGGVIVAGLLILSRLQQTTPGQAKLYLRRLSATSTWAVAAVLVSGVIKAYIATGGSLHLIRTSPWGYVLTFKACLVTLTVALGATNRWLLTPARQQRPTWPRQIKRTLRAEALCMLAVLLLSAWLANTAPPLE